MFHAGISRCIEWFWPLRPRKLLQGGQNPGPLRKSTQSCGWRANLQAGSAGELWSQYIQLTEAEAAFRALKSELSIRPLFHQKEPRVKAHVMVAFLGYALSGGVLRETPATPCYLVRLRKRSDVQYTILGRSQADIRNRNVKNLKHLQNP